MKKRVAYITLLLMASALRIQAQADLDPPVPPVLQLVSVDHSTGNVTVSWSLSPSSDVSGYVVYLFTGNEGYALDTLFNPSATSYLRTGSGSGYYSESFVVAALDTAGNISPLSNMLSTIYATVQIDTCDKHLEVKWNSYSPTPKEVTDYHILYSVNTGSFSDSLLAGPEMTSLVLEDFQVNAQYCFFVRAYLSGGPYSGSNKTCITTKMQRPPEWINADYATVVTDKEIVVSFTPDPMSEIGTYTVEKKTGNEGQFSQIYSFTNISGKTLYSDNKTDVSKVNWYRIKAINNCNNPVTVSNLASNMVLSVEKNEEEIRLSWNPYREWKGLAGSSKVYIKTGTELEERYTLPPSDSVLVINYSTLMYEVTQPEVCFMIRAFEISNPYTSDGESSSQIVCTPITERITVPTVFTPDNNSVNDLFRPVLSYTPLSYKLVITDMKRRTVFETTDFNESWDGSNNGVPQPEGVYMWFLKAKTPSGREVTRTGTVTIVHNR